MRWADLRHSYRAGCPVGPRAAADASHVSYWDFAGRPQVGSDRRRPPGRPRTIVDGLPAALDGALPDPAPPAGLRLPRRRRGVDGRRQHVRLQLPLRRRDDPLVDARLRRGDRRQPGREPVRPRLDRLAAGRPRRTSTGAATARAWPSAAACSCARSRRSAGSGARRSATTSTSRRRADERPAAPALGLRRPRRDRDALPGAARRGADAAGAGGRVCASASRRATGCSTRSWSRIRASASGVDLERGRLRRSSGDKEAALPLFESAFAQARRGRRGLARRRRGAHVRARRARPGRLRRVDEPRDRARGVLRGRRVLARPAAEQPRLGALRRRRARAGARRLRAGARGAGARSREPGRDRASPARRSPRRAAPLEPSASRRASRTAPRRRTGRSRRGGSRSRGSPSRRAGRPRR